MKKYRATRCGFIYFLLNQSMPGLVKIGFTTGALEDRLKQLNTSGVSEEFVIGAAFAVNDPRECERRIHEALSGYRANEDREFFRITLAKALKKSFSLIQSRIVSPLAKETPNPLCLTKDDVLFLQNILHDGQTKKRLISTEELVRDREDYHALELEKRLLELEETGLITRVCKTTEILGSWKMTPNGIRYMFEHKLAIQELIDEQKSAVARKHDLELADQREAAKLIGKLRTDKPR